jgi:mRNA interferase YafQ
MLNVEYSSAFKKDVKHVMLQGRDILKTFLPIAILLNEQLLPPQYSDHPLKGNWTGCRDFHIETDWIAIYHIARVIRFERTGTHTDLFEK